jgi:hypothetical protein
MRAVVVDTSRALAAAGVLLAEAAEFGAVGFGLHGAALLARRDREGAR